MIEQRRRGSPEQPAVAHDPPTHHERAARAAPWLRLFRRWPTPAESPAVLGDPMLRWIHDWLLTAGARPRVAAADLVEVGLESREGHREPVRYTTSARRQRRQGIPADEQDVQLVAPGSPTRDALLTAAIAWGTGRVLRLPDGPQSATALAKATFRPVPGARSDHPQDRTAIRTNATGTSLGLDRIPAGVRPVKHAGKVRTCNATAEVQGVVHEFAWQLRVSSYRGRREEIIRFAVEAQTGAPLDPLDLDQFDGCVPAAAESDLTERPQGHHLQAALEALDPAVRAAGRHERLCLLPAFERRKADIAHTTERLLRETPERAPEVLRARSREWERLADAFAVDVSLQLASVVTVLSRVVHVRVVFAHGTQVTVPVDVGRQRVMDPTCAGCGQTWQAGAACTRGHVTCLRCHQQCGHCGLRQCQLCTLPPQIACPLCGGSSCARCSAAAARGRHSHRQSRSEVATASNSADTRLAVLGEVAPASDSSRLSSDSSENAETSRVNDELQVSDLDAMSPATWMSLLRWLCEGFGWRVAPTSRPPTTPPTQTESEAEPILRWVVPGPLASRSDAPAFAQDRLNLATGTPVFVAGFRPGSSHGTLAAVEETLRAAMAHEPGGVGVLITTALNTTMPPDRPGAGRRTKLRPAYKGQALHVIGRADLEELLRAGGDASRRARMAADAATEQRAQAASRVREVLCEGLRACRDLLGSAPEASNADPDRTLPESNDQLRYRPAPADGETSDLPTFSSIFTISSTDSVGTAKQALAAIETLITEWELAFAPTPTRANTQEFLADVATMQQLEERGRHLLRVAISACSNLGKSEQANTLDGAWSTALRDELEQLCASLSSRCEALDPAAWRDYEAVRNQAAAVASVEQLAASARAAQRARALEHKRSARQRRSQE